MEVITVYATETEIYVLSKCLYMTSSIEKYISGPMVIYGDQY